MAPFSTLRKGWQYFQRRSAWKRALPCWLQLTPSPRGSIPVASGRRTKRPRPRLIASLLYLQRSSTWLNQVQLWFATIERDVIARVIFTSVSDLARKLRRYINAFSANGPSFSGSIQIPLAASLVTNSLR
jgi:hypothetical protein